MENCAATIGTFDGFHTGHQQLIRHLIDESRRRGLPSHIITFTNHPLATIAPDRVPPLLTDRDTLQRLLRQTDADKTTFIPFTKTLASQTARQFLATLRDTFGVTLLMMGHDNTFGSDRLKTHQEYTLAGQESGIEIIFDTPYTEPETGLRPASTLLRQLIKDGDITTHNKLAGRQFTLTGTVREGKHNGRTIGFPTLNLDIHPSLAIPATGVYAATATINGTTYPALTNIGTNPTVGPDNPITIETHVIGTDLGQQYGTPLTLTFSRRIRGQHRFNSLADLAAQIKLDIAAAMHP